MSKAKIVPFQVPLQSIDMDDALMAIT